jgi:hypothetical protein
MSSPKHVSSAVFLDPDRLNEVSPAEILDAAASGRLGLDHRLLHALLDRRTEAMSAVVAFSREDHSRDIVDLTPELVALFHHWRTEQGVPFLLDLIRQDPENVADEVMEAIVSIGSPALEPLLGLYSELDDETRNGEIAFLLASLGVRDDRVLKLLVDRLNYDLEDAVLMLGIYGDRAAIPDIAKAAQLLESSESQLRREIQDTLDALHQAPSERVGSEDPEPFDIYGLYPEKADLPVDVLDEDERTELLFHPLSAVRAAAAGAFFNQELSAELRNTILQVACHDPASEVRARAWEALMDSTEHGPVIEAMLSALRNPDLDVDERAGLLVGLSAEADRREVREAMLALYDVPEARAKALEAMWRSLYPGFRDYFAKHLDDSNLEVRRSAVWGVGYYGVKSELDKVRKLFDHEELRSDALFAYALAVPAEVNRARMRSLLTRIEKDAHGLSEMEEELVRAALDERLVLAGKEPVFRQQED